MSLVRRSTVAVLLVSLLVVSIFPAGSSAARDSQLATRAPVAVSGSLDLTTQGGAIHSQGGELPTPFDLEADEATVEFAWESGYKGGRPGHRPFVDVVDDGGRSNKTFTNVSVDISRSQGSPQILAYPGEARPSIEVSGTGDHRFDRLDASYMTMVGKSSRTRGAGDNETLGFWYEPDETWLIGREADHAEVAGNFSLFINNATVSVRSHGEAAWENWTGYQETLQGEAVQRYERHLLQIHVTGGRLVISSDDRIDVASRLLELETTGVVSSPSVSGRLTLDGQAFSFEEEPLRMRGTGTVTITEPPPRPQPGPWLNLGVGSGASFEVEGGERLTTTSGPSPILDGGLLLWGGLLAVTTVAVGGVAYQTGAAGAMVQHWRSRRYTKWMTRGRELAHARDHDAAVKCFRRATSAEPAKGVAWYHLAINLLEAERPAQALDVVDQAREGEAILDDLDFLELEVEASLRVGDAERCRAALARLADGSEPMARSLAADLQLDEEMLGAEMARRLGRDGGREDLPGYV